MDKVLIIKLNGLDMRDFCEQCESFKSDIDIIDGSNVLDAKDYDHVVLMSRNRNLCVSINSSDDDEISRFNRAMGKYKVK